MNRRDFFKRALGVAGAVAVAPLAGKDALRVLEPIIETAIPLRGFVERAPDHPPCGIPPKSPTMDEAIAFCVDYVEGWDGAHPGLKTRLAHQLLASQFGLPWETVRQALWKIDPAFDVDGWEHHAWALTEGSHR